MAVRILFLNSGGSDSEIAIQLVAQDNPTAEIVSFTLEVNDQKTLDDAKALADKMGVEHILLPFEEFRKRIQGKNTNTTTSYWMFESHYRGAQYAASNGFDYVASGGDARPLLGDVETLIQNVMDVERFGKKIRFLRPMRNVTNDAGREEMRKKIRNPR